MLSNKEMAELRWAHKHLEHPSLAARLSDILASPFEEVFKILPKTWRRRLDQSSQASIYRALKMARLSMPGNKMSNPQLWTHRFLAVSTGAASGFFGPLALIAELPLTTTLILRSIADIARSEGEDLRDREARIACVQVFALGGRTREDEAADVGYYGLRITLGLHFERDILEYATNAQGPHIPAAIDLVRAIAARFGVVISDKLAAQMVPIAGAASGAALNLIFMNHFQDVAKGHFIVRRLERHYSVDAIRDEYQRLMDEEAEAEKEFSPIEGW